MATVHIDTTTREIKALFMSQRTAEDTAYGTPSGETKVTVVDSVAASFIIGQILAGDNASAAFASLTGAQEANEAVERFRQQCLDWTEGLQRFGSVVAAAGEKYLDSAWDVFYTHVMPNPTTYPNSWVVTAANNARLGATDITSPQQFADSLYPARTQTVDRAKLWIAQADGSRTALAASVDYGALTTDVQLFRKARDRT